MAGPLVFVEETVARLRPSSALDVACGRGRHLEVLEAQGAIVTGIDRDEEALHVAGQRAPTATLVVRDVERRGLAPELKQGGFDLVLTTFFLYRPLIPDLAAALAPGGHWLLETFHVENVRLRARPRREALALEKGEGASLAEAAGLEVESCDEGERGNVYTTRLLARRP